MRVRMKNASHGVRLRAFGLRTAGTGGGCSSRAVCSDGVLVVAVVGGNSERASAVLVRKSVEITLRYKMFRFIV